MQTDRMIDRELQPYLARDAMRGLNEVLMQLPPGAHVNAGSMLGMTMLIEQAMRKPR